MKCFLFHIIISDGALKSWREIVLLKDHILYHDNRETKRKKLAKREGKNWVKDEMNEALEKAQTILQQPVHYVVLPPEFDENSRLTLFCMPDDDPKFSIEDRVTTFFDGRRWKAIVKEVVYELKLTVYFICSNFQLYLFVVET